MKVLGFSDEITTCDCCGKRNLRGTFAIETGAGEILRYGSVCVNKVYGKKRGEQIKSEAQYITRLQSVTWDRAIDLYSRGMFPSAYIEAKFENGKSPWNNSKAQMDAVAYFVSPSTKQVLKQRAA